MATIITLPIGNAIQTATNGSAQDGYVLTWVNASSQYQALPAAGGFTAGGDLSGSSSSQTVIKLQGNAVQSGANGASQDGYVLTWVNGSSQYQAKPTNVLTTQVKSGAYSVLATDGDILCDLSGAAFTVTLLASPVTGEKHTFKDYKGNAATNPLTIAGNGNNIEQFGGFNATPLVLNSNWLSVTLIFNGTTWSIL